MKKMALFVPALVAGPLALAVACGGPAEMDGTGGGDGSGGTDPSGGSTSDGAGGSETGGESSTGGTDTGGTASGGLTGEGGFGGFGGMGGFGGQLGDLTLLEACEALCETAVAGDASDCDEPTCVNECAYVFPPYYAAYGCDDEYLALKQCSAGLEGPDFFCELGTVGTTECDDEQQALASCY